MEENNERPLNITIDEARITNEEIINRGYVIELEGKNKCYELSFHKEEYNSVFIKSLYVDSVYVIMVDDRVFALMNPLNENFYPICDSYCAEYDLFMKNVNADFLSENLDTNFYKLEEKTRELLVEKNLGEKRKVKMI